MSRFRDFSLNEWLFLASAVIFLAVGIYRTAVGEDGLSASAFSMACTAYFYALRIDRERGGTR